MCDFCARSFECEGLYKMFDPACVYCGARLIQSIKNLRINKDQKIERCRKVLADWMAQGHSEKQLRSLSNEPHLVHEPFDLKPKKRGKK